jgi:hypothetical protein
VVLVTVWEMPKEWQLEREPVIRLDLLENGINIHDQLDINDAEFVNFFHVLL